MHNKLVPEVPTVPQTGDNPWMPALLGALALFAALSGGACSSCTIPAKAEKLPVAAMRIRAQKNENLFQRFLHRSLSLSLLGLLWFLVLQPGADQ